MSQLRRVKAQMANDENRFLIHLDVRVHDRG